MAYDPRGNLHYPYDIYFKRGGTMSSGDQSHSEIRDSLRRLCAGFPRPRLYPPISTNLMLSYVAAHAHGLPRSF